ncbi:MAG TPA: hypothetical protein VF996_00955 [Candidatus Saccharimonadales bacterium]
MNEDANKNEENIESETEIGDETQITNPKQPVPSKKKLWIIAAAFILLLAVASLIWLAQEDEPQSSNNQSSPSVTSYEECAGAGYPVTEDSSQRQCTTPDGRTFQEYLAVSPDEDKETDSKSIEDDGASEVTIGSNTVKITNAYYETSQAANYGYASCECSQFLIVEVLLSNLSDVDMTFLPGDFQVAKINGLYGDYEDSTVRKFKTITLQPGEFERVDILMLLPAETGDFPGGLSEAKLSWGTNNNQEVKFSIQ